MVRGRLERAATILSREAGRGTAVRRWRGGRILDRGEDSRRTLLHVAD
jgi:hypothetical protein